MTPVRAVSQVAAPLPHPQPLKRILTSSFLFTFVLLVIYLYNLFQVHFITLGENISIISKQHWQEWEAKSIPVLFCVLFIYTWQQNSV